LLTGTIEVVYDISVTAHELRGSVFFFWGSVRARKLG